MSCTNTMRKVEALAQDEYFMAAEQHGEIFASRHEGESVIREEVEETGEGVDEINIRHQSMWRRIRRNVSAKSVSESVVDLYNAAVETAAEAVQVAAMAMKMMATLEQEGKDGKD